MLTGHCMTGHEKTSYRRVRQFLQTSRDIWAGLAELEEPKGIELNRVQPDIQSSSA